MSAEFEKCIASLQSKPCTSSSVRLPTPDVKRIATLAEDLLKKGEMTHVALTTKFESEMIYNTSVHLGKRLDLFLVIDWIIQRTAEPRRKRKINQTSPDSADSLRDFASSLHDKLYRIVSKTAPRSHEGALNVPTVRNALENWARRPGVFSGRTAQIKNAIHYLKSLPPPMIEEPTHEEENESSESEFESSFVPSRADRTTHHFIEQERAKQKRVRLLGTLRPTNEPPLAECNELWGNVVARKQRWETSREQREIFWNWQPQTVEAAIKVCERLAKSVSLETEKPVKPSQSPSVSAQPKANKITDQSLSHKTDISKSVPPTFPYSQNSPSFQPTHSRPPVSAAPSHSSDQIPSSQQWIRQGGNLNGWLTSYNPNKYFRHQPPQNSVGSQSFRLPNYPPRNTYDIASRS
eukprot:94538_1